MRLLIAYDGSECANAAIADLHRAGLPASVEAVVVCVARRPALAMQVPVVAGPDYFDAPGPEPSNAFSHELLAARTHAGQATALIRAAFPQWAVTTDTWIDSIAESIIDKARVWQPDLLIVGSHNRLMLGRLALGGVTQFILHQAHCSVRVARHPHSSERPSPRLLIGVDGSAQSNAAVSRIRARPWPSGTQVRVLGVIDLLSARNARMVEPPAAPLVDYADVRDGICRAVNEAGKSLEESGLLVSTAVRDGRPERVLLSESEQWEADCIFVGARGLGGFQRALLGSVSAAVATHAQCSVEVVRR